MLMAGSCWVDVHTEATQIYFIADGEERRGGIWGGGMDRGKRGGPSTVAWSLHISKIRANTAP